jgi:hypothetical protein
MGLLFAGLGLIIGILLVVLGVPMVHYLKRDNAWMASDRSIRSWYNRK